MSIENSSKKPVFIYGLVNPINKRVFYVGATCQNVNVRFSNHISVMKGSVPYKSGCTLMRKKLYDKIVSKGLSVSIILLETTTFFLSDECESKWFSFYNEKGWLIQKNTGSYVKQAGFTIIERFRIDRQLNKNKSIVK